MGLCSDFQTPAFNQGLRKSGEKHGRQPATRPALDWTQRLKLHPAGAMGGASARPARSGASQAFVLENLPQAHLLLRPLHLERHLGVRVLHGHVVGQVVAVVARRTRPGLSLRRDLDVVQRPGRTVVAASLEEACFLKDTVGCVHRRDHHRGADVGKLQREELPAHVLKECLATVVVGLDDVVGPEHSRFS